MRVLTSHDIAALTDAAGLIPAMRRAFAEVSAGRAELPLRSLVKLPGANRMGLMAGHLDTAGHGIKVLSLFPANPARGLSSHTGLMLLFDPETGLPTLVMDAANLTTLRTAAASALATDLLARPDAASLALLGCGEQAAIHIAAIQSVRPLTRIAVWGRNPDKAAAFAEQHDIAHAETIADAIAGADILVSATSATTPFITRAMLRPGQHINAVGASIPSMQEYSADVIPAVTLVTDYLPSMEAQAAEVIEARARGLIRPDHKIAEIGTFPTRTSPTEITCFRSLGIAAQDLAAARELLARAEAGNIGTVIDMG